MENKPSEVSLSQFNWGLLGLSLLYFLVKGVRYFIIGSFVPLLLIVVVILVLGLTYRGRRRWFHRALKYWAVLLILWALGRFTIELLFLLNPNLTETHIREQFTVLQKLVSAAFLFTGWSLLKQIRTLKQSS